MTTTRTAQTRLTTLFHSYDARDIDLALDEAAQGLLADILSLDVMQDETAQPSGEKSRVYAIRNELREGLRQALTVYFMGGVVGVDGGDSDSRELHEQHNVIKPVPESPSKRKDN